MKVEMRATDSIKPYEKNPRKNDKAVDAVASSIKEFGFRQPIVVDKKGIIIVGHTRWKAAKKLGLNKVPVHVADLTPEQARAYRLADNKTNTLATWDMELLPIELSALKDMKFDMSVLGFDDINKYLNDNGNAQNNKIAFNKSFSIIVDCSDEEHQRRLYDKLTAEGEQCRVLTL
jgi:hypothetical protein